MQSGKIIEGMKSAGQARMRAAYEKINCVVAVHDNRDGDAAGMRK